HDSVLSLRDWALTGVPVIGAATLLAFTLPNTAQIFLSTDRDYRQRYANLPAAPRLPVAAWTPKPAFAVLAGAAFGVSLIYAST
ncbi:hypothetical protein R0J91_19355, partial [Micrococcus sp. SIMBA_131]